MRCLGKTVAIPIAIIALAPPLAGQNGDTAEILQTVESYIQGVDSHDTQLLDRVFLPGARIQAWVGRPYAADYSEWRRFTDAPAPSTAEQRKSRVLSIERSGTAAVATVELRWPEVTYLDFLSLLKTEDGWRIAGKLWDQTSPVGGGALVARETSPTGRIPTDETRDRGVVIRRFDGPQRYLEWEVVVPADPHSVWEAWTVEEEMVSWAAPGAFVDLRVGGAWEAHFEPDRPAGQRGSDANTIVDVVPGRRLHIRAGAPPEFPTVRAEGTDFTVELSPVGTSHTRVLVRQLDWQEGEEWDRAFDYLASANAEWLNWLHRRFINGPLEWPGG